MKLAEETASLDLLRDIDRTVDKLMEDVRYFDKTTRQLHEIEEVVKASPVRKGVFLDPEDRAIHALERAEEILKSSLPKIIRERASIDRDKSLTHEHRDSLHAAYEEWMLAATAHLEIIQKVRGVIIRHDMDAEDREKLQRFENAEDLIADLRQ